MFHEQNPELWILSNRPRFSSSTRKTFMFSRKRVYQPQSWWGESFFIQQNGPWANSSAFAIAVLVASDMDDLGCTNSKLVNKNTTKPEWQNQLQSSCSMVFLQGFLEFSLSITIPRYCIPAKNMHNISGLVLAIHPQIQTPSLGCHHLVGGFSPPLWKMMEFVNGKDDIPYMKWKIEKNDWNQQLVMVLISSKFQMISIISSNTLIILSYYLTIYIYIVIIIIYIYC